MAIHDVANFATLVSRSDDYNAGDTINFTQASLDGSGASAILNFDRGSINFTSDFSLTAVDLGSYGVKFTSESGETMVVSSTANIQWERTLSAADNHVIHLDANSGNLTVNLTNWEAIDGGAAAVVKNCWDIDANGGTLTATLDTCKANNSTNEGFIVRNGADVTLNTCTSIQNDSQAVACHDNSVITINNGTYSAGSGAEYALAFGAGTGTITVTGGTFTGTASIGVIGLSSGGVTLTMNNATITKVTSGNTIGTSTWANATATFNHCTFTSPANTEMWNNPTGTGAAVYFNACTFNVPANASNFYMDRGAATIKWIDCRFEGSGSTLSSYFIFPSNQTLTFAGCKFNDIDWGGVGGAHPQIPAPSGTTLNFHRNIVYTPNWTTAALANWCGIVGADGGTFNAEGNVFYGMPASGGIRYRAYMAIHAGTATVANNTFFRADDAPTLATAIYVDNVDPANITLRGTVVTGNYTDNVYYVDAADYNGTYTWNTGAGDLYDQGSGTYTAGTGDIEGGSVPVFANSSPANIDDAAGGFRLARDQTVSEATVLKVVTTAAHQIATNAPPWNISSDPDRRTAPLDIGGVGYVDSWKRRHMSGGNVTNNSGTVGGVAVSVS